MFLRICRYLIGKLMIEVLKMVKSVQFIKIKGPREVRPLGFDQKNCRGRRDLAIFEDLLEGCLGGGGGVTHGTV